MPEVPNSAFAQFDANDTAMKRSAKITAGPSSSGFPPVRPSAAAGTFDSADGLAYQNCSAQITRPASERPHSAGDSSHASVLLKNATIARIRKYMMAVASVMPACAGPFIAPSFAWRASTTVVAVDE